MLRDEWYTVGGLLMIETSENGDENGGGDRGGDGDGEDEGGGEDDGDGKNASFERRKCCRN